MPSKNKIPQGINQAELLMLLAMYYCVLQENLDSATVDWGIKVERVEMWVELMFESNSVEQNTDAIGLINVVKVKYTNISINKICYAIYEQDIVYSKDVRLPVQLQRSMAAEAEAAREARAKVRDMTTDIRLHFDWSLHLFLIGYQNIK